MFKILWFHLKIPVSCFDSKKLTHWKSNGKIQVIYSGSGTRALKSLFRSRPLRFTNVLQIDAHPSCECDKMIFDVQGVRNVLFLGEANKDFPF